MILLLAIGVGVQLFVLDPSKEDQALYDAAKKGDLSAVQTLLDEDADPNAMITYELLGTEYKETALRAAAGEGHTAIVKLLIEQEVDIEKESSLGKEAPLLAASYMGHIETVRLLLAAKARVDHPNKWGKTPLMWASDKGHIEVMRLLLKAGANRQLKDEDGKTALDYANAHNDAALKAQMLALLKS